MKKIAAMLAFALTTVCLTISASAAEANKKPFLDDFMNKYGDYVLIGGLAVFFIIAVIVLICSSRAHKKTKKEKKQREKKVKEKKSDKKEKAAAVQAADEEDLGTIKPVNYYHYDYRVYRNGELSYSHEQQFVRPLPTPHIPAVPAPRHGFKSPKHVQPRTLKPAEPTVPVRTVEIKTVLPEKVVHEDVVEIHDSANNKINTKHIFATVVLTLVGIHMLRKRFHK